MLQLCSTSKKFIHFSIGELIFYIDLKGSYDVAKNNIILCIWCNAMCLCGLMFKNNIIFHMLHIIVAPLCPAFLKSSSFWEARLVLIGQLSGALWLTEYHERVMEMLRPKKLIWLLSFYFLHLNTLDILLLTVKC